MKFFQKITAWARWNWPIWLLLAISTVVYHNWFSFNVFANADYWFLFSETLKDWLHYSAWESQMTLGSPNLFLWTYPFRLAAGAIGFFGFDLNVADKFLIFWPFIFLTPIFAYIFIREVLKNNWGAFIGACVFTFNTYYLAINTQGHLPLSLAGTFAPLVLLFYWRYFQNGRVKNLLVSALLTALVGAYDFRVTYILFFILLALPFWILLTQQGIEQKKIFFRQNFWPLTAFFGGLFLLNLFWIWPTAMTGSLLGNEIVDRSLVPNNYFLDLGKSLTLFHPFWNGSEPDWFKSHSIPLHFWLIPLMVVVSAFWARKDRKILFWVFVALVAIFLSKQDAAPLKGVYPWLHEHFPGFNAFREASKFYFAIALSYSVLIGYFVKQIHKTMPTGRQAYRIKHIIKYIFTFLIAGIFLWNVKPILTGEMFEIFTPREIPKNDLAIRESVLKQEAFGRTLLVTEGSKFMTFSNAHPVINATNTRRSNWGEILDFSNFQGDEPGSSEKNKLLFSGSFATNLLAQASVSSLIVAEKDFSTVSALAKNPAWSEVDLKMDAMRFFRNQAVRPRIYLTEKKETIHQVRPFVPAEFFSKNSARWDLTLSELKNDAWLNFSESYHPDWRLTCGDFRWYDTFFHRRMFSADNHYKTDAGLNAFRLEPTEWRDVCGGKAVENAKLSLFYRPQAYLYLGGIISLATIIISLLTLVFWREKRDNDIDV